MRKVPVPPAQLLLDLLRGPLALVVWVAAGASAVFLLLDRPPAATHVAWMPTTNKILLVIRKMPAKISPMTSRGI